MNINLISLIKKMDKSFNITIMHEAKTRLDNIELFMIVAEVSIDSNTKSVIGLSTNASKDEALKDLSNKICFLLNGKKEENAPAQEASNNKIYSTETIAKMKEFKKSKEINTDEKLMHYIKAWNPNITHKSQLTEELAKEFLEWVK